MAYVVGSVSVEVVPDFRNAQNKITAWFNSQPDAMRVPVRPDIDEKAARQVEQDAHQLGDRVGKAVRDGQKRNLDGEMKDVQSFLDKNEKARLRFLESIARDERNARTKSEREALRAEADHFKKLVDAHKRAVSQIEKEKIQFQIDTRRAEREARRAGNLVTRAVREEVHQNAGIIAAAIGGAILLGAPVAAAAAITVLGGVAAVAAAQSNELRQVWRGAWDEIRHGAAEDAAVVVPAYERMAGAIVTTFRDARPQFREAFGDLKNQIDTVSEAASDTVENVLPGLFDVLEEGQPIVAGTGQLFEKTATGVSNFFTEISTQAPAAGRALSQTGDVFENVLTLVGKLTAEGAVLANNILPLLNGGFGALNRVADVLGTSLSSVAAGFLVFQGARGAGRLLTKFGTDLQGIDARAGRLDGNLTKVGQTLGRMGSALPVAGVGLAIFGGAIEENESKINAWSDAIVQGGVAQKRAEQEMRDYQKAVDDGKTGVRGFLSSLAPMGNALQTVAQNSDEARKRADDYLNSLDPLTRANVELQRATNDVAYAQEKYGKDSWQAAQATADVEAAARTAAQAQEDLDVATRGVTEAMAEQAEQAFAAADKFYALEKQRQRVTTTQDEYLKQVKAAGKNSADAAIAARDYGEALSKVAAAASAAAIAELPASMDDSQKSILGAKAALEELDKIGFENLPPKIQELYHRLQNTAGQADQTRLAQEALAGAFDELGFAVERVPDSADIIIKDSTPEVRKRLEELGFSVSDIKNHPGEVRVSADTALAQASINDIVGLLADLGYTVTEPDIGANTDAYFRDSGKVQDDLRELEDMTATPEADLFWDPLQKAWVDAMGRLADLDAQKPTPEGNLKYDKLIGGWVDSMGRVFTLDKQRPTPIGDLNYNPFLQAWTDSMGRVYKLDDMRPTPVADLDDDAALVELVRLQTRINNLQGKTVTISAQLDSTIRGLLNWGTGQGDGPGIAMSVRGTGDGPGVQHAKMRDGVGDGIGVIVKGEAQGVIDDLRKISKNIASGPPLGSAPGWEAQWATVHARFPNATLNSSYRPGAITATGNRSYHAVGRAIDITPDMTIFNWLAANYPNSRELIYSPANGRQIWNGAPHLYSEPTRSDHFDHIHWAMRNGGAVNGMGGPLDDLNRRYLSNGEHVLDSRDVALMGGQQAVYAFREMLNSGTIGGAAGRAGNTIARAVANSSGGASDGLSVAGFVNNGTMVYRDEEAVMRKSEMSKRATMASLGY